MFFKNNKEPNKNEFFTKVAALLIHAAKIDENFSKEEGEIIKQEHIKKKKKKNEVEKIINEGKIIEEFFSLRFFKSIRLFKTVLILLCSHL